MIASKQGRVRDFQIVDSILARNDKGQERWKQGTIISKLGSRTYKVQIPGIGVPWKRHVNQLRSTEASPQYRPTDDSLDRLILNMPIPGVREDTINTPAPEVNTAPQAPQQTSLMMTPRPKRSCGPPKRLITTMD